MKLFESILNRSNSYNYYKNENKRLHEVIKQNVNDLKIKDKYINFLQQQLEILSENYCNEFDIFKKELQFNFGCLNKEISDYNQKFDNLHLELDKNDSDNREINNEIKYALIFKDTISESKWLKHKDFSLVNSAANYSFLYSLYRILDEVKPKNILEFGLGQTTKVTSQFANNFENSKLTVIESDQEWINNFSTKLKITDNINIIQRDIENFTYENTLNIRFKDVSEYICDDKFDLVIIDGPHGFITENGKTRNLDYSRSNIWELIPDNLSEDFVIIMDDYNRKGEKNTMNRVKYLLNNNGIDFYDYYCFGLKKQYALFTKKYKYLSWI